MAGEIEMHRAIGLADACELMAATFAYPTHALAEALVMGTYAEDARTCLVDSGASAEGDAVFGRCAALAGPSAGALGAAQSTERASQIFEMLRRAHSALYLLPTGNVRVWPYEGPFCYREEGRAGAPVLFRSRRQLDVERHMREAGVMPTDARREPSDSVWNEFSFLSFLYGSAAAAMHEGRDEDVERWRERIARFWSEHGSGWLPAFMNQTRAAAPEVPGGELYTTFAEIGQLVLEAIAKDAEAFPGVAER